MDLRRLAAKQKRALDWAAFAENELQEPSLKPIIDRTLAEYKRALADCWKRQEITAADVEKIDSLERDLEQLNNEARLRVVPAAGSSASSVGGRG